MTEQHLYDAQIGAVIEKVGGEGVAQSVRGEWFGDPGLDGIALDELPEGLARHAVAAAGRKQEVADPAAEDVQPWTACIVAQPVAGVLAERHQTLLAALAEDAHHALGQTDLARGEIDQFADAQTAGIEHFQHGAVAMAACVFGVRGVEQGFDVGLAQALGQRASELGRLDAGAGVDLDQTAPAQMLIELAQTGEQTRAGARVASLLGESGQIVEQIGALGGDQRAPALLVQPVGEGAQIGLIGGERVPAQAAFHPERIGETFDQCAVVHPVFRGPVPARACCRSALNTVKRPRVPAVGA